MTQEEKQLLLIDLCARLPYGNTEVKVTEPTNDIMDEVFVGKHICSTIDIEDFILGRFIIKPYLRPLSSMDEREKGFFMWLTSHRTVDDGFGGNVEMYSLKCIDWLNANGFDYRGLIPMGLALETKEGIY